ncbi:MAG TPA: dihydrofolate reductase [Candidatus Saccharimonadales bacterium]|nr:dihydrofolate reductase [Candidatus Saccharimonadales bacterium]
MKSIVVAYDLQRGIGANNDLLWQRDLPADLKHFRDMTMGKTIIMGRKTFESIGRALPGRQNIVVTHGSIAAPEIQVAHSLTDAYDLTERDICIIGGGTMYEQALDSVDTVHATEVKATFPAATVFFPELDPEWQEVSRENHQADDKNRYDYDFVTFKRR